MSDEQIPTPNLTPPVAGFTAPTIPVEDHTVPMKHRDVPRWVMGILLRVQQAVTEYDRVPSPDSIAAFQTYIESEIVAITGADMMQKSFDIRGERPDLMPFAHPQHPEPGNPAPTAGFPPDPAVPSLHSFDPHMKINRAHEHDGVAVIRGHLFTWHKILKRAQQEGNDPAVFMQQLRGRVLHLITNMQSEVR